MSRTKKLGYPIPAFDFRLLGVTWMSAGTHKCGCAAKGTSVVPYRELELRRHQYFVAADWPGGLYLSPTLARSQPSALGAACWTAEGVDILQAAQRILVAAAAIRQGSEAIPELRMPSDPLRIIALGSETFHVYGIVDA